ncbi:MAG: alpha/beta hydrolase [Phycisphaera sp.]|nr:MAG: alpha/beta hydrolase [Phycisphaera sp.]
MDLSRLLLWLALFPFLAACSPFGDANMSTADLDRALTQPVGGNAVSYVHSGDHTSTRVIYVHGTPGDAGAFAMYVRDGLKGVGSISIDRPGFGQTGGDIVRSFEAQAAAFEPLLVERDGRWPVLVGHSLGGPIVARAAADYPDRVAAIVIIAGSLDPELEGPRWFNYAGVLLSPALPRPLRVSNKEIFAAREQTELLADVLEHIRCPVVIVHGTRDRLVPYANVEYMRHAFTNAASIEVITIEDGNHFIPWQRPDVVRDAVVRAINAQPRRPQQPPS